MLNSSAPAPRWHRCQAAPRTGSLRTVLPAQGAVVDRGGLVACLLMRQGAAHAVVDVHASVDGTLLQVCLLQLIC